MTPHAPSYPAQPPRHAGQKIRAFLTWFSRFVRARLHRLKPAWLPSAPTTLSVAMSPNPCVVTDVLTLHLRGLRCCPTHVQVRSHTGKVYWEREIFPLSDHHRVPILLPSNAPPGMYHCVAVQPGRTPMKAWLALMDKV
jgi:hypothetical protein